MKGTGTVKHMILLQNGRKLNEFLLCYYGYSGRLMGVQQLILMKSVILKPGNAKRA